MILYCYPDREAVAHQAATLFVEAAIDAIENTGAFHVALSGGTTPKRMYEILAQFETFSDGIVARTHIFWGDERNVPNNHKDSNVSMARETLIAPRRIPRENVHAPNGNADNLELEALRHEIEIKRHVHLGPGGLPSFDLVLLGMGEDGHTASLFPATKALDARFRTFVANEVPQLNCRRLTLTTGAINAASYIMIVVTGKSKARILAEIFQSSGREPKYPVEMIRGNGSNVIWLADEAAVSEFTSQQRDYYLKS